MTNREWIMGLSDDELAKVIDADGCDHCAYCINGERHCRMGETNGCIIGIKKWLNAKHVNPMPEIKVGDIVYSYMNKDMEKFVVVSDTHACNFEGNIDIYVKWRELDICKINRFNDEIRLFEEIWRTDNG